MESATIIPGEGYLGLTKLSRPDAVSAMAPHVMGRSGTSHDVFIAGMVGNAGAAESAARVIINSNRDKVEAVASALEEQKSIDSNAISKAIDEVKNPKIQTATLFIEGEDRQKIKEKVEVRDNIVLIPSRLIEIFSSKNSMQRGSV